MTSLITMQVLFVCTICIQGWLHDDLGMITRIVYYLYTRMITWWFRDDYKDCVLFVYAWQVLFVWGQQRHRSQPVCRDLRACAGAAAVPDPVPQPDRAAGRRRRPGVRGGGRDAHWHCLEEEWPDSGATPGKMEITVV